MWGRGPTARTASIILSYSTPNPVNLPMPGACMQDVDPLKSCIRDRVQDRNSVPLQRSLIVTLRLFPFEGACSQHHGCVEAARGCSRNQRFELNSSVGIAHVRLPLHRSSAPNASTKLTTTKPTAPSLSPQSSFNEHKSNAPNMPNYPPPFPRATSTQRPPSAPASWPRSQTP